MKKQNFLLRTDRHTHKSKTVYWESFLFVGGTIIVCSQNYPGSLGHNFVGYTIYFIKKYLSSCINIRGDVNSCARVINESHKHWSPMNNDSTVFGECKYNDTLNASEKQC